MDIFLEDGHISNHGFKELIDEDINELQSLELSEHLSFCDNCLQRYLTVLDSSPYLEIENDVKKPVMKKIRHKSKFMIIKKATTIVSAATIAMAFFGINYITFSNNMNPKITHQNQKNISISFQINQAVSSFDELLNQLLNPLNDKNIEKENLPKNN